jgi:hypothetical protein
LYYKGNHEQCAEASREKQTGKKMVRQSYEKKEKVMASRGQVQRQDEIKGRGQQRV